MDGDTDDVTTCDDENASLTATEMEVRNNLLVLLMWSFSYVPDRSMNLSNVMIFMSVTHVPCSVLPHIPVLLTPPRLSLHARVFELFNLRHALPVHLLILIDQPATQYHTEHRHQ